jgi:TP901 family phage tail tape measure protein
MAKFISDENIRLNIIVNGNPAQKELLDLEKATRALNRTQKDLRAEKARLIAAGKQESKEYKNVTAEIKKNNATLKENKTRLEALQKEIGVTGLTMAQLKKRASVLRLALSHAIPGGEDEKRYRKELTAIGARLDILKLKGTQTKLSLSSIANGFNKYAALGASVIATTTGVVLGLQKMIDYNGKLSDAQSDVQKTTGLTKKEVDELTKSFGVFNTRTSRMDLLKIAEEGGRIGIAKNEIQDFVRVMNKANVALGDSFQGGPEEVASKLGKLKLLFKETKDIGVEDAYEAIGSAINELGANGVATETNIASFATRIGSLPDALKPTIQDALGLGAAFEESGVQAEISGRAYSIFLGEAAKNSDKFAEVMGITTAEVENMINTNPTEFFLQFSESLSETSEGGVDTAKTLAKLGLSADGVKKIVGAAGNNVDRFRELLSLSNKSMIDATSLTNEYDIKNNNLAATLSKVQKRLMGAFSSETVINGLTNLVTWFGKLIGAVKDVNEEFQAESDLSLKTAENSRKLANESQNLLDKYENLVKDGIKPTTEEKRELDKITLQLKDRLGDSVIAINTETGAYKLNTEAVREQIRLKSLMADEEAVNMISRKVRSKQDEELLKTGLPALEKEYSLRKELADEAKERFRASDAYEQKNNRARLSAIANLPEVLKERDAFLAVSSLKGKITEQTLRQLDLTEKLRALNVSEGDEASLFKVDEPKEGDIKNVGTTQFIFKNGVWVAITPTGGGTGGGTGGSAITPEEQAIMDSKARIAQFIADWNADQDLQKLLREEGEEALEIEKKQQEFDKLILEAENDTLLKTELEDIKEAEIQAIKDKWADIRLKKKEDEDAKYAKLDAKQKQALLKAEEELQQAKINAKNQGLNALQSLFGRESAIAKLAFGLQKSLAIQEILINTKKANAQIISNLAIANMKAVARNPLMGGLPWTGINTAIAVKHKLSNNLNAGAQIAGILATSIQGFEEGFYPVQRAQDGKMFNAQFGGQTKSGMVNKPTMFLAGENGPELIVDSKAFRQINPDIRSSFQREIARVKGFEAGYYPQPTNTNVAPQATEVSSGDTSVGNGEMINALNRASAIFEKLEKDGIIAYMSNDLKNGKLMQETIEDYNTLRNKNKR